MARIGRGFPIQPRVTQWRGTIPSLSYAVDTVGHLTLSGKSLALNNVADVTKVQFTIKQGWNGSNYASQTGVGYAVYRFNMTTQVIGTKLAGGTTETTDGSGVISIVTTTVGVGVGEQVLVIFWEIDGGPAGEDICGCSFETLVAGP